MSSKNREMNRREFLRSCLRNGLLTTLTIASGALIFRKKPEKPAQVCISRGICGGCRVFNNCVLPPAQSAKDRLKTIATEAQSSQR